MAVRMTEYPAVEATIADASDEIRHRDGIRNTRVPPCRVRAECISASGITIFDQPLGT